MLFGGRAGKDAEAGITLCSHPSLLDRGVPKRFAVALVPVVEVSGTSSSFAIDPICVYDELTSVVTEGCAGKDPFTPRTQCGAHGVGPRDGLGGETSSSSGYCALDGFTGAGALCADKGYGIKYAANTPAHSVIDVIPRPLR